MSGEPYWQKGKAKGRCLATKPGAGRCYLKPSHSGYHRAGTRVQWVEFTLERPVPRRVPNGGGT